MIAILGATGLLGSSLARSFAGASTEPLMLFARDAGKLARQGWPAHVSCCPMTDFAPDSFSLVVNAIGAGDPVLVGALGQQIVELTETWDHRILRNLDASAGYVFLSSGIVHQPVMTPYARAKRDAEMRHRALNKSILDLRVYSYADNAMPLTGGSFLAQLALAVVARSPFWTTSQEMRRDYAGAIELCAMIKAWRDSGQPNVPEDLFTLAPVLKSEILFHAREAFDIEVRVKDRLEPSATGADLDYIPAGSGSPFGYRPSRTSLDIVMSMLKLLVGSNRFLESSVPM